jgi:hypothetical protein
MARFQWYLQQMLGENLEVLKTPQNSMLLSEVRLQKPASAQAFHH